MGLQDRDWYHQAVKERDQELEAKSNRPSWTKVFQRKNKAGLYLGFFEGGPVSTPPRRKQTPIGQMHPALSVLLWLSIVLAVYGAVRLLVFFMK